MDRNTGIQTRKTYCRVCHAYCAMEADVDAAGKLLAVRGDPADPIYGGYSCIKGRQLPEMLNHPQRLRSCLRRTRGGGFEEISSEQLMDEVAERIAPLIKSDPRAVASYCGTHSFQNSAQLAVVRGWHTGAGSPSFYTSVTIDQPGLFVGMARHGLWSGGAHSVESADVILVVGNNPLVSVYSVYGGVSPFNPKKSFRDAKRRGLKVIVVDPRRTELARQADIHLALRPGEDATLLAGIARVILREGLCDKQFCAEHVTGLSELRAAVEPFTPEYVQARAGVPAEQLLTAARLYARGPRGGVSSGTGPCMAPHANVTEHFVYALATLCGRWNREGEAVPNPGILAPQARKAQAIPPFPITGRNEARVRGLREMVIAGVPEMPTAALADEILQPGRGQVKALFCMGGNPVVAWPNQRKVLRALDALPLLVCSDIRLSATSKRAHYIIAPKVTLEREDVNILTDSWYSKPYAHYTKAVAEPGFDAMEEWEFYWGLAQRLGTPIPLPGGELSLESKPTKLTVMELVLPKPRVPLSQIREAEGGQVYEHVQLRVAPADAGNTARLNVGPREVCDELRAIIAEPFSAGGAGYGAGADAFTHRLISRRLHHVYNSSGQYLPALRAQGETNPAYMNPGDCAQLGLARGDLIEIASAHAAIPAVAWPTDEIRSGVISMAHAWGETPDADAKVRSMGAATNRLTDDASDYDPVSGMARQSAIPVNVRPIGEAAAAVNSGAAAG